MKKTTIHTSIIFLLMLFPKLNFGQIPDFGAASGFAVFSSTGAFTNVGSTNVTGDVGNNAGSFTAFPPGTLNGKIHTVDSTSKKAAADLANANTSLLGITCGKTIATAIGSGQVITAGIYCQSAATILTGDLTLDAKGDANAIFIIKINGTFNTAASSNLILTNSASICNVYWHVSGAVVLGANSTFQGTIVSNGAVSMGDSAVLTGRVFTTAGAISLTNNDITIAVFPKASIISAGGPTTFCLGGSVVLSGNVNGIWSTSDTTSKLTVDTSNDYFVTNSNAFCSIESNHINVKVNPLPKATAGNNVTFCNGKNDTLGNSTVVGNTYVWTPATGLSSSTIANPVANPSVTTMYTLTETITATGCMNKDSVTVTVLDLLTAPVISANGTTTWCGNSYVVLSGNNGGIWSNTDSISTPSLSVDTSGDYFVTQTNKCNSVTSNHIIVTVNPQPAAVTGNDTSFCDGNFITLGGATIVGHTYSWTPSIGLDSTTSAHPVANPSATTTYTLTETITATGCFNSDSVIVTVNPLPSATTGINITICKGKNGTLGNTAVSGNTYTWTPATGLSSSTSANPVANPSATTTYTLIETITATGCFDTNSVIITVNPLPSATTISNTYICDGQSVAIGGNSTTGNSYLWKPIIGLNSSTISNPTANPSENITYTLTETVIATGCSNSNSVSILVNTVSNILIQPTNQTVLTGSTAVFYIEVSGTGHTYTWRKGLTALINGGNISGADTDSLTIYSVSSADTSSNYNVVISGACLNDTISQNVSLMLGLSTGVISYPNSNTSENISIFPNPFGGSVNVVVNEVFQTNLEIYFYNSLGMMVLSENLTPQLNTIETNNLANGIYFYNVMSNGKILKNGKLVRN